MAFHDLRPFLDRRAEHVHGIALVRVGVLFETHVQVGREREPIFSEPLLGPVFFEFIERKGNYREGFGEGNFGALFESMERDQINRGALEINPA